MLYKSNFLVEKTATNQGRTMEADTISKNGQSLKSQMSRRNIRLSFVLLLSVILATYNLSAQNNTEKKFYATLRYGYKYPFTYSITNPNASSDLYIWSIKVEFIPQENYNKGNNPVFRWINVNEGKPKIIPPKSKIQILETEGSYEIRVKPSVRSYENLLIKYTIEQSRKKDGSDKKTHTDYAYYEISWCGDGVVDTDRGEECDDINDKDCCDCKKNGKTQIL